MALRLRQTFTLFPGVRINIGKRGISTSIGGPGATLNISGKGLRATVGAPGTGISYSTMLVDFKEPGKTAPAHPKGTPVSPHPLPSAAPTGGNFPASARIYMPPSDMQAIASASIEVLTSTSLVPLRDLIAAAREQRKQVTADLKEANDEAARQWAELSRKKASIFRWFFRRRIASLEQELPMIEGEVKRLKEWERNTKISVDFEAGPEAQRAYEQMVRAFEVLRRSACKWDVTADRATNQPRVACPNEVVRFQS